MSLKDKLRKLGKNVSEAANKISQQAEEIQEKNLQRRMAHTKKLERRAGILEREQRARSRIQKVKEQRSAGFESGSMFGQSSKKKKKNPYSLF